MHYLTLILDLTMGTSSSNAAPLAASEESCDPFSNQGAGYRILGIQDNSPLLQGAGNITIFFDFLVAIHNVPLKASDSTLVDLLLSYEDSSVEVTLYNIKCRQSRKVLVTPTRRWEGEGLLGVTIRHDTYPTTSEANPLEDGGLIKILLVEEQSPAAEAELEVGEYLLGTPDVVFSSVEAIHMLLVQSIGNPIDIYVYNTSADAVRVVTIVPQKDKLLGAELGTGFLHRLPAPILKSPGCTAPSKRGYKAEVSPFGVSTGEGWSNSGTNATPEVSVAATSANTAPEVGLDAIEKKVSGDVVAGEGSPDDLSPAVESA